MKFKAFFFSAIVGLFSLTSLSAEPANDPIAEKEKMTKQEYKMALNDLKAKVESLREAKREATTRAEKQALREDIKDVKKQAEALKQQNSGIYIGGGALIIIILLILLL